MKKIKYLFISLLVGIFGMTMVEAKENPTFTTTLGVTKENGSDVINVEAVVKNTSTINDGVGLKSGKVYIYLDQNIVKRATEITGVYRNYNEATNTFTEENILCSYDGANHRVICTFGRIVTNPALVDYSDYKDELVVTFKTELCEGSTNCDIKVEVEGEAIDYNNGNPTSLSNGVKIMATKNFDCSSTISPDAPPQTPTEPEETPNTPNITPDDTPTYEPNENPNTVDSIEAYILIGTLSLILIMTLVTIKKKKLV